MQAEFLLLAEPQSDGMVSCAVRIQAPKDVDRSSSHLVLLLDVSGSMADDHKLENVKRCCQLVLEFLNADDHVSLITFGDKSDILLNRISVDPVNKEHIRSVISGLQDDGCTNLSAGLLNVKKVLEGDADAQKTGILLLTDGITNRGIVDVTQLQSIVEKLCTDFQQTSVHCVGYGTSHNAELLRLLAEQNHGSYNIVNSIEDTASAFGDTLGGLMSCFAQNVTLTLSPSSIVHGPYKNKQGVITLGDVNAGTQPILLVDIPVADLSTVVLRGTIVKDLAEFSITASWTRIVERNKEIELCRLRYECSDIMNNLTAWSTLSSRIQGTLKTRINNLETNVQDPFLAGHVVTEMIVQELVLMRDTLQSIRSRNMTQGLHSILSQHSAVLGLARGISTPTRSDPVHAEDDPTNCHPRVTFQNQVQQTISANLRTASMAPN